MLRLDDKRFVYLDVDDAPYVVRSARWDGERAIVRLSDDSEDHARPFDAARAQRPALRHRQGRASKRASRPPPWNTLAERIEERDGRLYLVDTDLGRA